MGYAVTQLGWSNDVYQLGRVGHKEYGDEGNLESLYTKVHKARQLYLHQKEGLQAREHRLACYQQYQSEISLIRETHASLLHKTLEFGIEAGWLIYKKPRETEKV